MNSSSNYVRNNEGINAFFSKIFVAKKPCNRRQVLYFEADKKLLPSLKLSCFINLLLWYILRTGFLRCATIDEIEAEKSVVEKDAVSFVVTLGLTTSFQVMILLCLCIFFQKERMEKTIETLRANFNAVRTGRANPSMLDRVEVKKFIQQKRH